jgi:ribosomal protein S3AE
MGRKLEPEIREEVKTICNKIAEGKRLTTKEKLLEVSKYEAASILTVRAGWQIKPDYIKQLTRGKQPRLTAARAIGSTYLYTVESLLKVRFTTAHNKTTTTTEKEDAA